MLALETATESCSVALQLASGQVLTRFEYAPRQQTDLLLGMIDNVLAEAGMSLNSVDVYAWAHGPGAFTGVRIAAAAVQALAFAHDRGVVGVSSLAVLAQGLHRSAGVDRVLAAFDARMNEIYLGAYALADNGLMRAQMNDCLCVPQTLPVSALVAQEVGQQEAAQSWHGAGSGFCYEALFRQQGVVLASVDVGFMPDARDVLPLATHIYVEDGAVSPESALPVYLRDEVAWNKMPGR